MCCAGTRERKRDFSGNLGKFTVRSFLQRAFRRRCSSVREKEGEREGETRFFSCQLFFHDDVAGLIMKINGLGIDFATYRRINHAAFSTSSIGIVIACSLYCDFGF